MTGYCECACRDCFDVAVAGEKAPHFCWACAESGCQVDADCARDDAYGVDEFEGVAEFENDWAEEDDAYEDLLEAASAKIRSGGTLTLDECDALARAALPGAPRAEVETRARTYDVMCSNYIAWKKGAP